MALDPFAPLALKRWIRGKIRIHFTGGHVAEVEVDQATADRLRRKVAGLEGPDYVEAPGVRWLQVADDVNLLEWTPAADLGWGAPDPEDRDILTKNGHPRGILRSLADIWEDSDHEAAYCLQAIRQLHFAARTDVPADVWARLARLLEGEPGVQVLKQAEASLRAATSSEPANSAGTAEEAAVGDGNDSRSRTAEGQSSTNSSGADNQSPQADESDEPPTDPTDASG